MKLFYSCLKQSVRAARPWEDMYGVLCGVENLGISGIEGADGGYARDRLISHITSDT